MNRERLKHRKFLREMSWVVGSVGFVLVMFDWLIWRAIFPAGPWWLRIVGGAVGLVMIWIAGKIVTHARTLGRRDSSPNDRVQ